jgi:hypothetical protein
MNLSDVERDAAQAAEALAGLVGRLSRRRPDTVEDDRVLSALAEEGGAAAERVLAYLRTLRGAGDGVATAVPSHLGLWRDWCPPRGHLLRAVPTRVPRRGHGDPGE